MSDSMLRVAFFGWAIGMGLPVGLIQSSRVRRNCASGCRDSVQIRRVLAIACVLNGKWRREATSVIGVGQQTVSD